MLIKTWIYCLRIRGLEVLEYIVRLRMNPKRLEENAVVVARKPKNEQREYEDEHVVQRKTEYSGKLGK